jgi:DNA-binding NarL/FixJ family response regulator
LSASPLFRILLVDDTRLWLDLLPTVFANHPTIQVIGAVSTEAQLWAFLKIEQPDLLLLDIFLDSATTDLRLAQQLKQTYPALRIVLLTSAGTNARLIQEANQLGLDGYLSKDIKAADLMALIEKAERGERIFSDDVTARLIQLHRQGVPQLTPKEQDILSRLSLGMKRASIIEALHIRSANTYDVHVHHIKEKFGAATTSELLRKAAEWGYV